MVEHSTTVSEELFPPMNRPTLWGQRYASVSVTDDGTPRALVRNTRITLWFVAETRRLSAHAGCNTTMFDADLVGDILDARAPCSTLMACSPESEGQDLWLIEFLTRGPTFAVSEDGLVLTNSRTWIAFERVRDSEPESVGSRRFAPEPVGARGSFW